MNTSEQPSTPDQPPRKPPQRNPTRPRSVTAEQPATPRPIRVTNHRWEHWKATAADHSQTLTRWLTDLADAASGYQPPTTPPNHS